MTGVSTAARVLTARWVLTISDPPLEYGGIQIEDDCITAVYTAEQVAHLRADETGPRRVFEEHGHSIIVPSFVNLHTHVEWTAQELFDTSSSLFEWIPGLVESARHWRTEDFLSSAAAGVARIASSGTSCILDSSYTGQAVLAVSAAGLRGIVGLELFGLDDSMCDQLWQKFLARREAVLANSAISGNVKLSAAPHAPYTVCPALIRKAQEYAADNGVPFTMHVAESRNEFDWIDGGDTMLDEFLQKVHVLPGGKLDNIPWRRSKRSPVRMLADENLLGEWLVIAHAVQLTDEDIELLAKHKVKVAHCPRSNSRLRNGIAPLRKLLEAGVTVGIGTDSAGSTDNLSVLSELRFAWNLHRAVDPSFPFDSETALKLITINGANALGMSGLIGTLQPGKQADLAIFNIVAAGPWVEKRPYDALLYGNVRLHELLVGGRKVSVNRLY